MSKTIKMSKKQKDTYAVTMYNKLFDLLSKVEQQDVINTYAYNASYARINGYSLSNKELIKFCKL
jgi:hypothetical protein